MKSRKELVREINSFRGFKINCSTVFVHKKPRIILVTYKKDSMFR